MYLSLSDNNYNVSDITPQDFRNLFFSTYLSTVVCSVVENVTDIRFELGEKYSTVKVQKVRHDTSSQVDQITNEGKEKELKDFLSVRVETETII